MRGRVPVDVYDALCRRAAVEGKSVCAVVGDSLITIFRSKSWRPDRRMS